MRRNPHPGSNHLRRFTITAEDCVLLFRRLRESLLWFCTPLRRGSSDNNNSASSNSRGPTEYSLSLTTVQHFPRSGTKHSWLFTVQVGRPFFRMWPVERIANAVHLLLAWQYWICQAKGHPHAAASLMVWRFRFKNYNGDTQHLVFIKSEQFLSTFLITSFTSKTRVELGPAKSYWS